MALPGALSLPGSGLVISVARMVDGGRWEVGERRDRNGSGAVLSGRVFWDELLVLMLSGAGLRDFVPGGVSLRLFGAGSMVRAKPGSGCSSTMAGGGITGKVAVRGV